MTQWEIEGHRDTERQSKTDRESDTVRDIGM